MDVEFVVQLLQLAHVAQHPEILVPGTLQAISRLEQAGLLDKSIADTLKCSYQFLRSIESGIRLMNLSARHELPTEPAELERLAFLLKAENRSSLDGDELVGACQQARAECRGIFEATFQRWLPAENDEPPDNH